ncbi:MAG: amino acid ABC transporter permease [Alphaproteobacteria bacterium]|nr:amino acid ABC transporter permease [Alphaproteobacteria bacterium]
MKLDWSVPWQYRWMLADGVLVTVMLAVLTMAIAIPGGIAVMLLRQSGSRVLRAVGAAFVEFFRNLPLILLVYWSFYVLPIIVDIQLSPFATGLVALCLNVSAYNAETFRAGVNSIRAGQRNAGLALGMSRWQVMRKVILPQSTRRILPVLASTWVSLFKDTSLVSVIAVGDLAHNALQIRSQTFRVLEMLTVMAAIYWCLGYPQAKLVDWIHRRYGVSE